MVRTNGANPKAEANGGEMITSQPSRGRQMFDQPVVLRQSPRWSRAVVWGIVGVTVSTVAWACLAKMEEAIPAQGKLEPQGVVQPVQAPVGGVIETVHVNEGEFVEAGDVLVSLDPQATRAQLRSLEQIQNNLSTENQYLRAQLANSFSTTPPADIPPDIAQLTSNRNALAAENALYRAQLQGDSTGASLPPALQQRLRTSQAELNSRLTIAGLEVEQLNRQLTQVREQLANARNALRVNQDILNRISPLAEKGAISEIQFLQQEQEVNNRQTEVNRLLEEEQRLELDIVQSEEEFRNTLIGSQDDVQQRIGQNDTQIAAIDSQLTDTVLENENRLQEIESQIAQLQQTLQYQELKAPVSGTVFNLQANKAGYVANSTEPILEIVPGDNLVARVFITNRDIGFVEEGMPVDVRIDSFPYSEFGDITGTLSQIGSDALPPNQQENQPFYRFPAEVELDAQSLSDEASSGLELQSGMSVTANIRTRKRRVIMIFADLFIRKIDSLKSGS
ncbi:hemolysin D [filamentous cyanobacterium CCP5]|nr:hemolysin D [filamentous cyanobacterium CCP5]